MLPQEALREAAKLIEAGWCQGDGSHSGHARDAAGRPVPLHVGAVRAAINPEAASYTLYGALATVMRVIRVDRVALVFDVLYRLSTAENDMDPGGTNHVHPVMAFNETPGQTKDRVLALLELAAQEAEAVGDGPFPSPIPLPSADALNARSTQ